MISSFKGSTLGQEREQPGWSDGNGLNSGVAAGTGMGQWRYRQARETESLNLPGFFF